jgi:hypothetical protein
MKRGFLPRRREGVKSLIVCDIAALRRCGEEWNEEPKTMNQKQ